MKRFAIGLAALAASICIAPVAASAADMADRARVHHERYDRPIPRVYYQSVRPTAICRVAFLRDKSGWPKERGVARCADVR